MITKDQLKEIEQFAEMQFCKAEIALMMESDEVNEALSGKKTKTKPLLSKDDAETIRRAVRRGQLKGEAQVRKAVMTQATQGATNAQKIALDLVMTRKEIDDEDE